MGIISTIVIGFVVGLLARFLLPGKDGMGFVMTTVLGIGGALLAGFAMQNLGYAQPGQPAGFVASVVGAIVVLLIYRRVRRDG
ncbi:MAG: GlsB/YeaQ/YmgE family stress response membrane protein [Alphaproteobacteria bacterium]|nr:GlsB/YeaQ/YmgE family stress response membrane protein [Alphaproteobacteria bacterium]